MLDKVFYFKIGKHDIRVALPHSKMGRLFTFVMCGIFVFDFMSGNVVGMILMGLFIAMNTEYVKEENERLNRKE